MSVCRQNRRVPYLREHGFWLPVVSCLALSPGGERLGYLDREQMAMGNQVSFRPFGRRAEPGTCLYIRCGGPLPVKKELRLTVRVNEGRQRSRNPAGADTRPLAAYSLSSRSRSGIQRVKLLEDGTFGFLFDGQIRFLLEEEMEPWEVDQEEGYFLRFRLEESQYELPPAVSFLDLNTLKVKQKETAACWLSAEENGDGTFRAAHALCICGELRVFLQEEEQYREIPAQIQLQDPGSGSVKIRPEVLLPDGSRVHVLAGRKEDWYEGHRILGTVSAAWRRRERSCWRPACGCREEKGTSRRTDSARTRPGPLEILGQTIPGEPAGAGMKRRLPRHLTGSEGSSLPPEIW